MHKVAGHIAPSHEKRNLLLTVALNLGIAVAELIGGLLSNSLALISDAIHNLGDGLSLLIAYISLIISRKTPDQQLTFGYKRIQIMAALFNAITLVLICLFLIREAWIRLNQPEEVHGIGMLTVASIGLLANILGVWLLRNFRKDNINIRAAYLHLVGDTLSSVAVIACGLLIVFKGWNWVDPLVTLIISGYIIKETWQILSESFGILIQKAPPGTQIQAISESISTIPGIKNMHHIHIWRLTDNETHLEAHLELDRDLLLSEVQECMDQVEATIRQQFGISHITLQPELERCDSHNLIAGEHCNE
ncbi:MAG TPA: cation diffusion facilitator family transporter [Bacteroidales bacterium]|nr:cation diffusion facilitator family transporter [Bacteroidales bacterium]